MLLEHVPSNLNWKFWRRRPDLNRGWRFCRFYGVANRVVSCWCLVGPAPPFYLLLGPYWTTFGLQSVPRPTPTWLLPIPHVCRPVAARRPPTKSARRARLLTKQSRLISWEVDLRP